MQLHKAWDERREEAPAWPHRMLGSTGQAVTPNVEPALNGQVATLQQPQEMEGRCKGLSDSRKLANFCCFVSADTGPLPNAPQLLHSRWMWW